MAQKSVIRVPVMRVLHVGVLTNFDKMGKYFVVHSVAVSAIQEFRPDPVHLALVRVKLLQTCESFYTLSTLYRLLHLKRADLFTPFFAVSVRTKVLILI